MDRIGRGGGLALFWKEVALCTFLHFSNNYIDVEVGELNGLKWRLTGYYGFPERHRGREA